ncbi:MAG: ATP synthase F1 subunit gamma [Deltaproteobacteria bacterium]|nr:ATP synthase F1 subunit gamma [Deltaproteobacteria bacterium]
MANLKQIRKRIASVKSTQKITRAMKMVAAARLRRAQENITNLRPYALQTLELLSSVAARAGDEEIHPLLARRDPKRVMLVVLTSDRGLAGAFNANINKAAYRFINQLKEKESEVLLCTIGRKGYDFLRRRNIPIQKNFRDIYQKVDSEKGREIGTTVIQAYSENKLDAVYLVYNEFKSAISQKVVMEQLLPITPMEGIDAASSIDFIYEPNKRALLDTLLPMYVHGEIFRALLESIASEHGARMTAMDNATTNAGEMIDKLTLKLNRARQAAITKELMEIIGGAEALKG